VVEVGGVVVAVAEEESVLALDQVVVPAVVPVVDLAVDLAVDLVVGQVLVPGLGRAPVVAPVLGRAWRSRRRVTG